MLLPYTENVVMKHACTLVVDILNKICVLFQTLCVTCCKDKHQLATFVLNHYLSFHYLKAYYSFDMESYYIIFYMIIATQTNRCTFCTLEQSQIQSAVLPVCLEYWKETIAQETTFIVVVLANGCLISCVHLFTRHMTKDLSKHII